MCCFLKLLRGRKRFLRRNWWCYRTNEFQYSDMIITDCKRLPCDSTVLNLTLAGGDGVQRVRPFLRFGEYRKWGYTVKYVDLWIRGRPKPRSVQILGLGLFMSELFYPLWKIGPTYIQTQPRTQYGYKKDTIWLSKGWRRIGVSWEDGMLSSRLTSPY